MKKIVLLLLLGSVKLAFAWNLAGHKVVAQIAYDNLTPQAKSYFNFLNHRLDVIYPPKSLVNAASWLDELRFRDIELYTTWHYVDIPFSMDDTPLPAIDTVNAVWALNQSYKVITSKKSNDFEKGFQLRIILHVVGDIHQPLHAVTRVSEALPEGDKGGNFVSLPGNSIAKNLHSYWDRAGGLFNQANVHYNRRKIARLARSIENEYPRQSFDLSDSDFMAWAQQSHQLAKSNVYGLLQNQKPDKYYQKMTRKLAKKQVALAGYRLADLLNLIAEVNIRQKEYA